jgi:hypothetical protein
MKKLFILALFLIPTFLYSQFLVVEDTILYNSRDKTTKIIKKGEIVKPSDTAYAISDLIMPNSNVRSTVINLYYDSNYDNNILAKYLVPVNTKDTFSSDLLIDYDNLQINSSQYDIARNYKSWLTSEMWVPVYYIDALKNKNRNLLIQNWKYLFECYDGATDHLGPVDRWYNRYSVEWGSWKFYNSAIDASLGTGFLIKNIEKTRYGYAVDCRELRVNQINSLENYFNWSLSDPVTHSTNGSDIKLLLYLDGDFLDMYVNDLNHYFGTLVRVKERFIRQFMNLVRNNNADITGVQFPTRAEKKFTVGEKYHNAENLRIRSNAGINSSVIKSIPKDTIVEVLSIGKTEKIDDITAPWVQVRTQDGTTGWCFGGYLVINE